MARRALLSYNIVLHLSSLSAAFGSSLGPRCLFFSDQSMTKINSPTLHTSPSTIFTMHHHHLRPSPVAYKHYSPVTQPVPFVLALSCLAFSLLYGLFVLDQATSGVSLTSIWFPVHFHALSQGWVVGTRHASVVHVLPAHRCNAIPAIPVFHPSNFFQFKCSPMSLYVRTYLEQFQ